MLEPMSSKAALAVKVLQSDRRLVYIAGYAGSGMDACSHTAKGVTVGRSVLCKIETLDGMCRCGPPATCRRTVCAKPCITGRPCRRCTCGRHFRPVSQPLHLQYSQLWSRQPAYGDAASCVFVYILSPGAPCSRLRSLLPEAAPACPSPSPLPRAPHPHRTRHNVYNEPSAAVPSRGPYQALAARAPTSHISQPLSQHPGWPDIAVTRDFALGYRVSPVAGGGHSGRVRQSFPATCACPSLIILGK